MASISGDRKYSAIINEERGDFLAYPAETIEVAKSLACRHLVIHSNAIDEEGNMTTGAEIGYAKKIASLTRTVYEAAALAEAAGITLVLEAVNNISRPGYFMTTTVVSGDIARVVGSPYVKILYDVWHMQQMEGNLVYHLREYSDVLGYVHIADAPERQEPGTGEINFDRIKKVLKELRYDGIFGFEFDPSQSSAKAIEVIKNF